MSACGSDESGETMPQKRVVYECVRCGTCCRWPGYVRVEEKELDAIAEYLDITIEELIEKFTALTADRQSLTVVENPDGSCAFLDRDNTCMINPVKPQQCRDFPAKWQAGTYQKFCKAERRFVDDE